MGSGSDRPRTGWSSLKQRWSEEDLTVVRGRLPLGNIPWHNVDFVSVYLYIFSIKVLKKNVTLIAQCWNTYRFWFRAILDVRIGPWRASTLQQGISTFLTRLGRRFHLTTGKCSSRAYCIFYPPCCMRCTFTITDRGAIWRTQRLRGHSLFIMWMQTVCHNRK